MAIGGRIDWDEAALAALMTSPGGGVARELQRDGELVAQEAKRLAPTSPHGSGGRPSGWLRSQIGFAMGSDGEGLFVDIATPATTEAGAPYGLFQEVGTSKMAAHPHIRPALDVLR